MSPKKPVSVSTPGEMAVRYPPPQEILKPKYGLTEEAAREAAERAAQYERDVQEIAQAAVLSIEAVMKAQNPEKGTFDVRYKDYGKTGKGITYSIVIPAPEIRMKSRTVEYRGFLPRGIIPKVKQTYLDAGWDKVYISPDQYNRPPQWRIRLVDKKTPPTGK